MPAKILTCAVALVSAAFLSAAARAQTKSHVFRESFAVDRTDLLSTGRNQYFVLEPGLRRTYEGREDGKAVRLVITVLNQTEKIDGVETRIVEERESHDGQIVEISRNFFAISRKTNDVFYFGEDVDIYVDGKIVNHEGAWRSGVAGAHFGLMMPGRAMVGEKYYQERAPGVALDRAEIVSVRETLQTPAGLFKECLKIEETTPLESGRKEYKIYAKGVGLVRDGALSLVSGK